MHETKTAQNISIRWQAELVARLSQATAGGAAKEKDTATRWFMNLYPFWALAHREFLGIAHSGWYLGKRAICLGT
ncbi:MAG: hypothetical protein VXW88_02335 [Pseudomonadota bacterium]|nr:hypothetical protein [Pseudomonadota bacterium]